MGMPLPAEDRVWTAADLATLPNDDGKRYEIIDGVLYVSPSPSAVHQRLLVDLLLILGPYVREGPVGEIFVAPLDVPFDDFNVVEPDLLVCALHPGRTKVGDVLEAGTLVLAAEILSPSTGRRDKTIKRRLYQRFQVGEYWVVDPFTRMIERWLPNDERPQVLDHELTWQPTQASVPFTLDVEALFNAALGPEESA